MKNMDIQVEKLRFIEQYMKIKDEAIIEKLSSTLKMEVSKLKRVTISKEEKEAIKAGLKDIEAGRVHTHEEVMDRIRAKYLNIK